ncbi:MAG TPA: DoxX family protein, partial [Patescibacteria group bacterium]
MRKTNKATNIVLWILQVLFALYFVSGGLFMMNNYKILAGAKALSLLPHVFWILLGVAEIVLATGLVLPGLLKLSAKLTWISAAGLALISLLGIGLYPAYRGIGILWA